MKYFGLGLLLMASTTFAAETFQIGSGGVTGTYYPSIETLCQLVNQYQSETFECRVTATAGSVANIRALADGKLQFGIVQGDVLYHAYTGQGAFAAQAQKKLRSVLALYPELLALVTSQNSGIETLHAIAGKRIHAGSSGSGTAATVEALLNEAQLDPASLRGGDGLSSEDCPAALQKGQIDGYFYMVGHPTDNILQAAQATPVRLVMLDGTPVYRLLEKYPYYTAGKIRAGTYPGVEEDLPTFGVKATLVTLEETPDAMVEALLATVLTHFDEFQQRHPHPEIMDQNSFVQGLSAPLHPAAKAYYTEKEIQ